MWQVRPVAEWQRARFVVRGHPEQYQAGLRLLLDPVVKRTSCGVHYEVDPTASSDIYLDDDTLDEIERGGYELSIKGVSLFLRQRHPAHSPVCLSWDLTSRCNLSCPFCYIRDNSIAREVTLAEAKPVIDHLVDRGLFEAHLAGGECLLVDDFLPIYEYLKARGVFLTIFTNGILIDDAVLASWAALPPSSVEVTFYDSDFSSAPFQNVLRLRDMGIHVETKFTLTQTTFPHYLAVKRWAEEQGFELLVDTELIDGGDEHHQGLAGRFGLSPEQKAELLPDRFPRKPSSEVGYKTGFPCIARFGTVHVAPDFSVALCDAMTQRWDLRGADLETALGEISQLVATYTDQRLIGCGGCTDAARCNLCFARAVIGPEGLAVPEGHCAQMVPTCSSC